MVPASAGCNMCFEMEQIADLSRNSKTARMSNSMNRRGMTMMELIVAGALLATLLIVCLKMFDAAADWRRKCDRRRLARIECENVMERMAALPWDKLTSETAAEQRLPENVVRMLPGAELKVEITDSPPEEKPAWRRIVVSIVRRDTAGETMAPLVLTTWRYFPEKAKKTEEEQEAKQAEEAEKDVPAASDEEKKADKAEPAKEDEKKKDDKNEPAEGDADKRAEKDVPAAEEGEEKSDE